MTKALSFLSYAKMFLHHLQLYDQKVTQQFERRSSICYRARLSQKDTRLRQTNSQVRELCRLDVNSQRQN